jgi:hypothetical protein
MVLCIENTKFIFITCITDTYYAGLFITLCCYCKGLVLTDASEFRDNFLYVGKVIFIDVYDKKNVTFKY